MSKIDYDLTKIKGVVFDVDGVLSPSTIPMGDDGQPRRMVNIKDGYAMQLAVKKGLQLAIITGAKTPSLRNRYTALGVTDVYLGASLKLPLLQSWLEKTGLKPEEVAFVGDDIPDFEAMCAVGLKVAPLDSAVEIREIADYITPCNGGYGVARDLLEHIMRAQGLWMNREDAFGW